MSELNLTISIEPINEHVSQISATSKESNFIAFVFQGNTKQEDIEGISEKLDDYSVLLQDEYAEILSAKAKIFPLVAKNIIAIEKIEAPTLGKKVKIILYIFDLIKSNAIAYLSDNDEDQLADWLTKQSKWFDDFAQTGILLRTG